MNILILACIHSSQLINRSLRFFQMNMYFLYMKIGLPSDMVRKLTTVLQQNQSILGYPGYHGDFMHTEYLT
jgi:hypothetical protein